MCPILAIRFCSFISGRAGGLPLDQKLSKTIRDIKFGLALIVKCRTDNSGGNSITNFRNCQF